MVITLPTSGNTKPAPAEARTSRMGRIKPLGAPAASHRSRQLKNSPGRRCAARNDVTSYCGRFARDLSHLTPNCCKSFLNVKKLIAYNINSCNQGGATAKRDGRQRSSVTWCHFFDCIQCLLLNVPDSVGTPFCTYQIESSMFMTALSFCPGVCCFGTAGVRTFLCCIVAKAVLGLGHAARK